MRKGGCLIVAEVLSRFASIRLFNKLLEKLGFRLVHAVGRPQQKNLGTHFNLQVYRKASTPAVALDASCLQVFPPAQQPAEDAELVRAADSLLALSQLVLKPCIYKRR